jgi:hypothetical protein
MANHVQNYITVIGNDAVMQKFANDVANNKEEKEITNWEGKPMKILEHVSIEQLSFMPKYDEDKSWDWYCDNVGAKWAHIDDGDDDYVNIVSAWSPVSEFCMKLVEHLCLVDPEVLIRHQYEDEFRNFVGIQIYWAEDEKADCDHEQLEDTDITELMLEKFPEWEDDEFDIYDYQEAYDCVPGEVLDDFIWQWMDEQWEDLHRPFKEKEKEGSFYGYNEKNDNYVHGLDD